MRKQAAVLPEMKVNICGGVKASARLHTEKGDPA